MTSSRAIVPGGICFALLALYGTLRWGTMLAGAQQRGLLAVLAAALAGSALLRALRRRGRRRWAAPVLVGESLLIVAWSGFGWRWLVSLRPGLLVREIGAAVGTLGGLLVPIDPAASLTAAALTLGAGLLLALAGTLFALQGPRSGLLLRTVAGILLVSLAVVPSAIVTPRLVGFHGLLSFALLAAFVFGPQIPAGRRGAAVGLLAVAGVAGALGAGVLGAGGPWVSVDGAGSSHGDSVGSGAGNVSVVEGFNWQQSYGVHGWPFSGATVLTVSAHRPLYWKAEDLDTFTGTGWSNADAGDHTALQGVAAATRAAYSETLNIQVGQLSSPQIIGAGYTARPLLATGGGGAPGTWTTSPPLHAGESYSVSVYAPTPPAAQLAAAGTDYPAALAPFRRLSLPAGVYSGVEGLAARLAVGTTSPLDDIRHVLAFLRRGYIYTLDPPPGGRYPLVSFLLHSHRGYCQQFAGAMALLLRMRGIPARVAVGFSTGNQIPHTGRYLVADDDAHAWVEVWFPSFGWVSFDPTPGQASTAAIESQTLTGGPAAPPVEALGGPARVLQQRGGTTAHRPATTARTAPTLTSRGRGSSGGSVVPAWLAAVVALILALSVAGRWGRRRGLWTPVGAAELSGELESAFRRCGQPLDPADTLEELAQRVADRPAAARYLCALAACRFTSLPVPVRSTDRAELRHWLARRGGRRAAWMALPPRRLIVALPPSDPLRKPPGGSLD